MVLYYSSTGNTEFIAKQIARKIDDDSINLLSRIKNNDYSPIESKKPFVICSPIYVCEMPRFLADYLKKVRLTFLRKKKMTLYLINLMMKKLLNYFIK